MVNVIRINGEVLYEREIPQDVQEEVEGLLQYVKTHKPQLLRDVMICMAVVTLPYTMGMSGGMNLILLLQKASFWVGMGVTIWGLIEMGLDAPGWRGRILKGVIMYVGVLIVPLVFLELQNSLQVDVWDEINKGTQKVTNP